MTDTANDLFVGSSTAFLDTSWNPASIIKDTLDGCRLTEGGSLSVVLWPDWFKAHPGMETFQALDMAAKTAEWAVMIFSQDDMKRTIGEVIEKATVRDNVLFELGLFFGHLGTSRVFILEHVQKKASHIASDISGIQRIRFWDRKSFSEALVSVAKTIDQRSKTFFARWVPTSSLAIGYVEQAMKPFIEKRRDSGTGRGGFAIEVLVPTRSFEGTDLSHTRQLFEAAGCIQVGPTGSATGRPSLWSFPQDGLSMRYFDVPTTLLTAKKVIDGYITMQATPTEMARLIGSQARAFCQHIHQQKVAFPEIKILTFSDLQEVADYLKKARASLTRKR